VVAEVDATLKPPVPLERDVQRDVVTLYRRFGCTVCSLSQGYRPGGPRHGTTRQTKGLADLRVFLPAKGLTWEHEVKRPGGEQSPEQAEFERLVTACGVAYALGGTGAALLALRDVAEFRLTISPGNLAPDDRLHLP